MLIIGVVLRPLQNSGTMKKRVNVNNQNSNKAISGIIKKDNIINIRI
jgi:hypothetical protein